MATIRICDNCGHHLNPKDTYKVVLIDQVNQPNKKYDFEVCRACFIDLKTDLEEYSPQEAKHETD